MSKKNLNVKAEITDEGNVTLTISEETRARIPRVGDTMYIIKPYPFDDDDEDDNGKVKEDAIMAFSYAKRMIKSTLIDDEGENVLVNGDFKLPLNDGMTIQTNKLMVFTKEEDAKNKFESLMNASIKAAKEFKEKYTKIELYLNEAVEKNHH